VYGAVWNYRKDYIMLSVNRIYNMCLLAVEDISSMAGSEIGLDDVEKVMNSEISNEEKTNFFIQYLLAQREPLLNFCKTLVFALVVFIIGRKLVNMLLKMTNKWMERRGAEAGIQKFVMSFAGLVYNILLIFVVAGILGVGTSSIVAMVGSAGLAVGLALQGSLSNLAGGVLILLLKPFKVGDYIITVGEEGTVESIDIFYTRIHTTDNKVIVIPNGTISNSNVTNTSNQEDRMLVLDFMVHYSAETAKVRKIVLEILREDERICQDKDMSVVVCKLNPARVKMQAKAWVKNSDYWNTRFDLLENMKDILMENGIDIS
jgi:small conductance mechanosensitive channel